MDLIFEAKFDNDPYLLYIELKIQITGLNQLNKTWRWLLASHLFLRNNLEDPGDYQWLFPLLSPLMYNVQKWSDIR